MAKPVEEKYIQKSELHFQGSFPASYRNSMKSENGGTVATEDDYWELFPIFDETNKKSIAKTIYNIVKETEKLKNTPGFPDNAIAIGENGCGDILIIFPDQNQVHKWFHESHSFELIANDFSDLERE